MFGVTLVALGGLSLLAGAKELTLTSGCVAKPRE